MVKGKVGRFLKIALQISQSKEKCGQNFPPVDLRTAIFPI